MNDGHIIAKFGIELILNEALDFVETREYKGRIPGYVMKNTILLSELSVKTAFLQCSDAAEDDPEDAEEPVILGLI